MITVQEAYIILENDLLFFRKKDIQQVQISDYDNLIIYTATRELITQYRDKIYVTYEPSNIISAAKNNLFLIEDINKFVTAGVNLDKSNFFLREQPTNDFLIRTSGKIIENISFGNTWAMLQNYYMDHGYKIDNTELIVMESNSHKRFTYGKLENHSIETLRKIWISFSPNKNEAFISIKPSLSEKRAYLAKQTGNRYEYQGYDPDYYFVLELNKYDSIKSFQLEVKPKFLRIEYYEE